MSVYGYLWVFMSFYEYLWVCMGVYGFLWVYGYLLVTWVSMGFMGPYGCLWVFMGVYRCSWIPPGVYGFLGVYGRLWVSEFMGIYKHHGYLCVLYLNIKNIAYFLIQEPQKIWVPQKTSEITHVL